jgi:hypothetical protein
MNNRTNWISNRVRLGWLFLAAGIVVGGAGLYIESQFSFLLIGIGVGYLVRYMPALKDSQSARRLSVEERDERTLLIRARAGNRAYWVSAALIYFGLVWSSFAANGSLPPLSGDSLWYFLAAAVLIPFRVYVFSVLLDQRTL